MSQDSARADYFDRIYAGQADPWSYGASGYEQQKYRATLDALPRPRFRHGLEIGCSIGVLSRLLATRCDRLLAIDFSEVALASARQQIPANTVFARAAVPAQFPDGRFDLIVFSEVLYYLAPGDLDATAGRAMAGLDVDGVVVLVNWLGETGAASDGNAAADAFIRRAAPRLRLLRHEAMPEYRLDLLGR